MAIRRILLPVMAGQSLEPSLLAGLMLGRKFKAHVEAFLPQWGPDLPLHPLGYLGWISEDTQAALFDNAQRRAIETESAARQEFEAICRQGDVQVVSEPRGPGAETARFSVKIGWPGQLIPQTARLHDLTVLSAPSSAQGPPLKTLVERVLLESGRPLLLLPDAVPADLGSAICIAWDGSIEATRAIAATLPFLEHANSIEIVTLDREGEETADPGDLIEYLAWHGLRSKSSIIESNQGSPGSALLHEAKERGSDLLIMGGYGHNRFQESILGGATQIVLKEAQLPVVFVH